MINKSNVEVYFPVRNSNVEWELLFKLDKLNMEHPWSKYSWESSVCKGDNYFILTIKTERSDVFGFILGRLNLSSGVVEIDKVVIDKAFQGNGHAKILIKYLDVFLKNQFSRPGIETLTILLEVEELNTVARNLYLKSGFIDIGEREGFYSSGKTAITYRKYLKFSG